MNAINKQSDNHQRENSAELVKDRNQPSASNAIQHNSSCDNKPDGEEIKSTLDGIIYQLELSMSYLQIALDKKYNFELYPDTEDAQKFDDVTFVFEKNGEYRFLQVKPKLNPKNHKITVDELLSEDSFINLEKYFLFFCKIKKNQQYKDKIKDFIICINVDFSNDICTTSRLTTRCPKEETNDAILVGTKRYCLTFIKHLPSYYNSNINIIRKLESAFSTHRENVTELDSTRLSVNNDLSRSLVTEPEIEEFFYKLVFVVVQPNETKLIPNKIFNILNRIRDNFQANLICVNIQKTMLNWLKRSKHIALANTDDFFRKARERIVKEVLLSIPDLQYSGNVKKELVRILDKRDEIRYYVENIKNQEKNSIENLIDFLIPQNKYKVTELNQLNNTYYSLYLFDKNIIRDINSIKSIQEKCTNKIIIFLANVECRSIPRLESLLKELNTDLKYLQSFFIDITHHPDIIADTKSRINEIFQEFAGQMDDYYRLKRQGVLLSRILRILTPEMSEVFNSVLDKLSGEIAENYCENVLFDLINYFIGTMKTEDLLQVDKLAFLEMTVKFCNRQISYGHELPVNLIKLT